MSASNSTRIRNVAVFMAVALAAFAGYAVGSPAYTRGDIFIATDSTHQGRLAAGTLGHVITSNGPGELPSYEEPADSGAPADADYLVKTAHADLSAERVATDTTSITWDWGTAGQAKAQRAALSGDVTAAANSNSVTVDQARGLRETAGPTTLTMGAVVDGELLVRSGTTITSVAASGTGTVTSVALTAPTTEFDVANSPVTTSGTLAITWDTQTANKVLASATSGGAAAPSFRALVADDIPSLTLSKISDDGALAALNTVNTGQIDDDAVTFPKMVNIATDRLIGRDAASTGNPEEIAVGGGLEFTGSAGIQRSALTGDVTATAGSNSTTIANDAVTYAKMQDVSDTNKVLGRSTAGAGIVEEITCTSAGRAIIDDADAAAQRTTLLLDRYFGSVTGDQNTSLQTLADISSMSGFSLAASATYYIDVNCLVTTNATTVGILISPNFSVAVTSINFNTTYPTSATAFTSERISALQGGTLPTAGPGATLVPYRMSGFIVTNGAGTFAMQFRSETATQTTIKAGSTIYIARVN